MVRKRHVGVIDSSSTSDYDVGGSDDVQCSQMPHMYSDSYLSESGKDDDSSSDCSSFDLHMYQQCVDDYQRLKDLKRKLKRKLKHKSKKKKCVSSKNDGFTRFSVSGLMNVISSLSPEKKAVIESYGFGSLLKFSKCYVPNNFAKWVARLVDSKFGDIIRDGKVISLSEESVHLVLDIPNGRMPFLTDSTAGRDLVLSKFGKDKIPPFSFFADKLKEDLPDEDVFICFMVVALSCFLCPNTNTVPSPKYFGVFEDIDHMKDYNCCGYVLEWLLDHVKAFNRGSNYKKKRHQGLGGCLYYLAVVYLDHIDFRHRQVPDIILRISVWKDDMINFYSSLDCKSPGVYDYRPLLDYEKTYYYKSIHAWCTSCADELDEEFCKNLEIATGCDIPLSLKIIISKLIDQHSFNSGVSVNMDVNSLCNVSKEFQVMFMKLMNHVCRTDKRSKQLVVDVVRAIAATDRGDVSDDDLGTGNMPPGLSGNEREDYDNLGAFKTPGNPLRSACKNVLGNISGAPKFASDKGCAYGGVGANNAGCHRDVGGIKSDVNRSDPDVKSCKWVLRPRRR